MKIPKLQFSLASIFVAFIGMAIVMSFYRQQDFVEERVHFHTIKSANAETRIRDLSMQMQVIQQGRAALLAGDQDELDNLRSRYRFGQPLEVAYVPIQLAEVDKSVNDIQAEIALLEIVQKYHAELALEFENARWQPWRHVAEGTPPTNWMSSNANAPVSGQQDGMSLPKNK
jgi:hypothetical protein